MSAELKIVHSTFPDRETAERIAALLVDAGLAACAQVGADLVTFYHWEGSVKKDREVSVSFKVLSARFDLFVGELQLQHPYKVPQIIAWPASFVNKPYIAWAKGKSQ